jgi:hypothetical protein
MKTKCSNVWGNPSSSLASVASQEINNRNSTINSELAKIRVQVWSTVHGHPREVKTSLGGRTKSERSTVFKNTNNTGHKVWAFRFALLKLLTVDLKKKMERSRRELIRLEDMGLIRWNWTPFKKNPRYRQAYNFGPLVNFWIHSPRGACYNQNASQIKMKNLKIGAFAVVIEAL